MARAFPARAAAASLALAPAAYLAGHAWLAALLAGSTAALLTAAALSAAVRGGGAALQSAGHAVASTLQQASPGHPDPALFSKGLHNLGEWTATAAMKDDAETFCLKNARKAAGGMSHALIKGWKTVFP